MHLKAQNYANHGFADITNICNGYLSSLKCSRDQSQMLETISAGFRARDEKEIKC